MERDNLNFFSDEEHIGELERLTREDDEVEDCDTDEEDHVDESEHDTDSALSENEEDDVAEESNQEYYFSKNRQVKWAQNPVHISNRTRKENIISHLPGIHHAYKSTATELDAFSIFFCDEVFELLVNYTNLYITLVQGNYKRIQDAKLTDKDEIRAFIGLLLLAGVHNAYHLNYKELWDRDGPSVFALTMTSERFLFLLRCLRFDNKSDRKERKMCDKLAPIRELLTVLADKFNKAYSPHEFVTIDEQFVSFRGRCSFRQYLPNKPNKYGIKIFAMVDSKTYYLLKFEVHVGTQPSGQYCLSNSANDVVLRLIEPIKGSGRNVTTDNWYTSIPLAISLLNNNLTLVGTMQKNKAEIPIEFLPHKQRGLNTSLFGFTKDMTLTSYVSAKSKAVVLLSTLHHDKTIDETTSDERKPEIITFYNHTKGAVDSNEQLCSNYTVGRRTDRWPLCLFFHFLNVAGINSYVVYKTNNRNISKNYTRRIFLKNLAHQLICAHIIRRSANLHIPRNLRHRIKIYLEDQNIIVETFNQSSDATNQQKKRKRCSSCPSNKDNKHKQFCELCEEAVCKLHTHVFCPRCKPGI